MIKLPFEFEQTESDLMTPESERKLATIIPGIEQLFDDDQKAYEGLFHLGVIDQEFKRLKRMNVSKR